MNAILGLLGLLVASLALTCPATDRDVLTSIYDATNGPAWTVTNNWLSDDAVCTWTGVTCNIAGQIIEINLSNSGLDGALPDVIGCLTNLKTLYLNGNSLVGDIPPEICELTHLQYLQINSAGLTGEIPTCMCTMTSLMFIYLSNNTLTGEIPSCMGDLEFLKELHLDCNQLSGSVPAGLFTLEHLIELYLQCNPELVCTTPPDTFTGRYECGTENYDCTSCASNVPTNCAECITIEDCGLYCLTPPS
ncbi:Cyst wall protein 1 [Giardia muris]|uniref:Cyst wall protein 1 n=1 Tax=Giardia muris TaxID=5742 RepID=A0A4Z1T4P3_GIAMU|nr:Cyst wall protein 1 [Giardia muris]|eukprot:TNJ30638.1 Cyst wall protein 1 [Giardia muris]